MKLHGFKNLLIKKADGNENLETLIRFINDEVLAEQVIESLEKMAASKGDKANSAVTSWAGNATNADVGMLHDALGHHVSNFMAANKARPPKISTESIGKEGKRYNAPKVDMDPVAAQHLERAMHLADLASKASKHSLGKLNFDHVPTQAWEMNRTGAQTRTDSNGQTKYLDDQQGLKRRLSGEGSKFPNHGYLLTNPHEAYKHKGKLRGHEGAYPFEEMKINDKNIHIDPNTEAPTKYVEHEFDKHPLFDKQGKKQTWEMPETHRDASHHESYLNGLDKWHDSDHLENFLDRHEKMEDTDPKAYSQRGSVPSKGLDNVKKVIKEREPVTEGTSAPVQTASDRGLLSAPVQQKPKQKVGTVVTRKEPKASKVKENEIINNLSKIQATQNYKQSMMQLTRLLKGWMNNA